MAAVEDRSSADLHHLSSWEKLAHLRAGLCYDRRPVMVRAAFPLAIVLVAASAAAAPRPPGIGVHLEYQRAPRAQQCPGEIELRGWVAAGLGHDPFTETGPWRLIINVNRRRDGAFIATTTLFDDKEPPPAPWIRS